MPPRVGEGPVAVNNGLSNEVGKRVRTRHQFPHCVKRSTVTPRSGVEWAAYTRRCERDRRMKRTDMRCWARRSIVKLALSRRRTNGFHNVSLGPHVGHGRGQKAGIAPQRPGRGGRPGSGLWICLQRWAPTILPPEFGSMPRPPQPPRPITVAPGNQRP